MSHEPLEIEEFRTDIGASWGDLLRYVGHCTCGYRTRECYPRSIAEFDLALHVSQRTADSSDERKSNDYQQPMANGQDHPLKNVDPAILAAARLPLEAAVTWKDVHPDMAEPIADAVVMALLPWLKERS